MKSFFTRLLGLSRNQEPPGRFLTPVDAPTPTPAGAERDFGADLRPSPADEGQKHPAPTPAGAERDLDAGKRDKPATDGLLRAACVDQVNDECASRKGLNESALGAQAGAAADAGGAFDVRELERAAREIDEERALGARWIDALVSEPHERRRAQHLYAITASAYGRDPVGSPNWRLYWTGFAHRALIKEQVSAGTSARSLDQAAYTEMLTMAGSGQVAMYSSAEGFTRPVVATETAGLNITPFDLATGIAAGSLTRMPARDVFEVGDIVTRNGTDEQEVTRADDGGGCITVVCRKEPEDGWCKVGEEEDNLTRRYSLVRRRGEVACGDIVDSVTPYRKRLRDLVDLAWNEATESTTVPDTAWADRLIDKAFGEVASVQNVEPSEWSGWACQYPGKLPRLYGALEIAELNCDSANGDRLIHLSAQSATQPAGALTDAARDVLAERQRQISEEGWTPEHDDQYLHGEMASAAGCYAMFTLAFPVGDPASFWPWSLEWWKPSNDHRRNLVKAGALIQAEIERLDRKARPQGASDHGQQ